MKNFLSDESGSLAIDWAVLAATTIGLGAFMFDGVAGPIEHLAHDIEATLASIPIPTSFAAYRELN